MKKTSGLSYNKDVSFLNNVLIAPETKLVFFYTHFMRDTNNVGEHSHSFYELHIVIDGRCAIRCGGKKTALLPNSCILIPPGTLHKFEDCSDDFFRYSIALDIVKKEKSMLGLQNVIIKQLNRNCRFYIKKIIDEHENSRIGYENIINSMISCLTIEILRLTHLSIEEENARSAAQQNLSSALEFIDRNLSRSITLTDVAKEVHLSTRQIDRIFKDSIDFTVTQYIKNKKLENVKEYLEKTDLSVKEIGVLTGFGDEASLCKQFKKQFGVTCSIYRKKNKGAALQ